MSQASTKKNNDEESAFRDSEEVKEAAEDKEYGANPADNAGEVRDNAPEEVSEVAGWHMSFCTNCGKGLDSESNFCPKCGVRTENGVKAGVAIPWTSEPHVRQELEVAMQMASKTFDEGVKIVRETFREFASEVEKGVQQTRTNVPIKCQNCGQDNSKFAKFCSKCGNKL